jgi:glycerol kinase
MSSYTTPAHVARATLEANAFMTRAVSESMKVDSGVDLPQMKASPMTHLLNNTRSLMLNRAGGRWHDKR